MPLWSHSVGRCAYCGFKSGIDIFLVSFKVLGACIQSYEVIPIIMACTLRRQHSDSQVVERQARLLWRNDVMRADCVGIGFDEPIQVDSCTFLGTLIPNSRIFQDSAE
jgi:hypothetical protein